MADLTQESAAENTEKTAPPTPPISGNSQPPPSTASLDPKAFAEQVVPHLRELLRADIVAENEKVWQQGKDKRYPQIEKEVREMKARLDAAGGDATKAAERIALETLLNQPPSQPASAGNGNGADRQTNFEKKTADILNEAGIALDDPEVVELAKKPVAEEGDYYRALTSLAVKRAKQATTSGTPAFDAAARPAASNPEKEQRKQQLMAEKGRYIMNRNLPENAKRIAEIDDELKRLG